MPDIAPDGFIYDSPGRRIDPQSGQLYVREEDPEFRRYIDYLGYSPERAAEAMGYDPTDQNTWGRWVQGTDKPSTFYKTLGLFLAGAGLGGLGGGYLAPFIGGGVGGGGAAAAAAPSLGIAGGTALPASLVASTAVPGFAAGTAAGAVAGATATGAGSGLGGGGAAGGTAAATTPTLTASTGIPAGTALPGAVPGAASGGGTLGTLRNLYGKYGDYAKTGLKVANDIEQGRSADRAQQNQYAALDDALANQRYGLERQNAIANAQAPAQFSRQVVLGDILANLQPFTYDNKTGKMTGGLGPWVLGENSRTSGQALSKSALDRQLSNNPYNLPAIPTPTPRQTGGKVDTALNILGTVGTGLDAYDAIRADRTKPSQYAQLLEIFGRRPGPNVEQPGQPAPRRPTVTAPDDDPYAPLRPRVRQPVSDPYQYLQPARG